MYLVEKVAQRCLGFQINENFVIKLTRKKSLTTTFLHTSEGLCDIC